jgi:hypothetical protein
MNLSANNKSWSIQSVSSRTIKITKSCYIQTPVSRYPYKQGGSTNHHIWELIPIFTLWVFIHQMEWTLIFSNNWKTVDSLALKIRLLIRCSKEPIWFGLVEEFRLSHHIVSVFKFWLKDIVIYLYSNVRHTLNKIIYVKKTY